MREARAAAGLSVRGLAARSAVSASTVARIESGRMDPTVGTLSRILAAAGRELVLTCAEAGATAKGSPTHRLRLADLSGAWRPTSWGEEPDWTRFRALLDLLAANPSDVAGTIRKRPEPSGSGVIDALIAGIAEKLADDARIARPAWTGLVPAVEHSWAVPGTARMLARRRDATPPQLALRGLTVDEGSLWRTAA